MYPWMGVCTDGTDVMQTKDRQGELFYYMHQQMLARYDAERLAVGLPRVDAFSDWDSPIQASGNTTQQKQKQKQKQKQTECF